MDAKRKLLNSLCLSAVNTQVKFLHTASGRMSAISFIEEPKTIDRIIRHFELTFEAERPPRFVQQDLLMAAGESGEYF